MGRKLPQNPQPQIPETSQTRDEFETPRYATEIIIPFLQKEGIKEILEPACGSGRMVDALRRGGNFERVTGTCLPDYNFLKVIKSDSTIGLPDAIVTNPPYSLKFKFIHHALELDLPFAFLIPAAYCREMYELHKLGCEKIIPTRRIDYLTPNMLQRINAAIGGILYSRRMGWDKSEVEDNSYNGKFSYWFKGEKVTCPTVDVLKMWDTTVDSYASLSDVPISTLRAFSSSYYHSLWLTHGLHHIGATETWIELTNEMKNNIL